MPLPPNPLVAALTLVATPDPKRSEATLCHQIATLIAQANLSLKIDDLEEVEFEAPLGDGTRRRIDIEAANCIIEVKKTLVGPKAGKDAGNQLAGYISARSEDTGQRHVGVLTDGREWRLLHLDRDGQLIELDRLTVDITAPDADRWSLWIEGVFATLRDLVPAPAEVSRRLGAGTSGFRIDVASLRLLWDQAKMIGDARLKRRLWAKSLATAFGSDFDYDDDDLFINHTYLVIVAELIAHSAAGFPITGNVAPADLISGEVFRSNAIRGVVEPDFFDWVTEVPDGALFVSDLARRLSRFRWAEVEHDVLKVLYESVIDVETRHRLGEYYTPDWLARAIVKEVVTGSLDETVGDPACGSGTFLFHVIRLKAATGASDGKKPEDILSGIIASTWGTDLHPVAVTLARVTFLLALGSDLLAARTGDGFTVPVSLGDSLQWDQIDQGTIFGSTSIRVSTDGAELFNRDLAFPISTMTDLARFDRLVAEIARRATAKNRGSKVLGKAFLDKHGVKDTADQSVVQDTFGVMCDLHDAGQNHIWGYYVRNLARPRWLSLAVNQADVLVGNPPWVAFRHFAAKLQEAFVDRARTLGVYPPSKFKSNAELASLFVAASIDQYLHDGGRFAFVMPRSTLTGPHYEGFRSGSWPAKNPLLTVKFSEAWDLRGVVPPFFPVSSGVVFGTKGGTAVGLPTAVTLWHGDLGSDPKHIPPDRADEALSTTPSQVVRAGHPMSPYYESFSEGSPLVPRMFFSVLPAPPAAGLVPVPADQVAVVSYKSGLEDIAFRNLPALSEKIERRYIFPVIRGENIAPYRVLSRDRCLIPWDRANSTILEDEDGLVDAPGVWRWWSEASRLWMKHGKGKKSLAEQIDYMGALSDQAKLVSFRVVYPTSGVYMAATKVTDPDFVVAHSAYWAEVGSGAEADYLVAVLNSAALLADIVELQPVGGFNSTPRHFSRYPLYPPIPEFDPKNPTHSKLAAASKKAAAVAAAVPVDGVNFKTARKRIRAEIAASGLEQTISSLVVNLLAGG